MKNILLGIFVLIVSQSFTTDNGNPPVENGKLSGLVTFEETYKSPGQADAGCELYVMNEADVRSTPYVDISTVVENFVRNKSSYAISMYNAVDPGRIKKLQDDFYTFSDYAGKYISGFKKLPGIVRALANGTGNYSLNLRPGKYYVLFFSGNAKSNNSVEIKGKLEYRMVEIKPGRDTFLDVNFEKQEMIGLRLTTGWQLTGC